MTRRDFAVYLSLTPGMGGTSLTRVLNRVDMLGTSVEEFFRLSPEALVEEFRLRRAVADKIIEQRLTGAEQVRALQDRLTKLGVSLVTAADAHYPQMIEQMDKQPPCLLFLYGNQKLIQGKTFSVLSSRNTSPAGMDQIDALTEAGVLNGEIVVSSDNRPEYQRSALVPLRWGAPRILCLDRGLFQVLGPDLNNEPFRAARLWRYQFDAGTDLAISPFHPEAKFNGVNNQVRDRLVACLSRRLDFVEVAPSGQMEKLAIMALEAGRAVAVSDRSVSYRKLQQAGAKIITA
jgi:DNA processing protein